MKLHFHFIPGSSSDGWNFDSTYAITVGNLSHDIDSVEDLNEIGASQRHNHCFTQTEYSQEMHFRRQILIPMFLSFRKASLFFLNIDFQASHFCRSKTIISSKRIRYVKLEESAHVPRNAAATHCWIRSVKQGSA